MIRIRLTGRRGVPKVLQESLTRAVAESAGELRDTARDLLDRSGGDSRPGEAPRRDSGRLRDSLFVRANGLSAEVGTALGYGAHLEFGTQNMAARPWLQPAFEASKDRIKARLKTAVRAALRGRGFS